MRNIKEQDDILCISPLKKYTPPKYPTSVESRSNPALLKKLPSRWQKSAKVLACIGLVGTIALSSACTADRIWTNENYEQLIIRPHWGGCVGAPIYVAYLTEQEALAIIRAEAEAAGLNLNATSLNTDGNLRISRLDDEEKGIALAYITLRNTRGYPRGMGWFVSDVIEEFEKQNNDMTLEVFHQRGEHVESRQRPNAEEKAETRELLEEHLTAQVRDFIELLREQGIIE